MLRIQTFPHQVFSAKLFNGKTSSQQLEKVTILVSFLLNFVCILPHSLTGYKLTAGHIQVTGLLIKWEECQVHPTGADQGHSAKKFK